jgi:hypothetical protein
VKSSLPSQRHSCVTATLDLPLFRPDVSPGRHRKCESLRALPTADVCRWLLLLLSPLLSAVGGPGLLFRRSGRIVQDRPSLAADRQRAALMQVYIRCQLAADRLESAIRELAPTRFACNSRARNGYLKERAAR